jgi:hypothetical protein
MAIGSSLYLSFNFLTESKLFAVLYVLRMSPLQYCNLQNFFRKSFLWKHYMSNENKPFNFVYVFLQFNNPSSQIIITLSELLSFEYIKSNQIKELQTNMPTDGSKASIWYIPSFLSHTQTYALKHSHTPEFSNAHSFLENVSSHNSIIVKFDRTTKREVLGLRKKNTHRPSNLIHLVQTRKLNKCF